MKNTAPSQAPRSGLAPINMVHITYLLFVLGIFLFPLIIVAMIINYLKEDDVAGTWLHTHYVWQAHVFWKALLWYFVGILLCLIVIGVFVIFGVYIWYLYQMIKGWIALSDGHVMHNF